MNQKWNLSQLDTERQAAALDLLPILGVCGAPDGMAVRHIADCDGLRVVFDGKSAEIHCRRDALLFRGLGLLAELAAGEEPAERAETPCYDDLGIMLDCSRGAVPTLESARKFIRHMALMGYTSLQLYTEDTYEVPEYPYFGYLRGRFSQADLRNLDAYAASFCIELVPCIQTLAHLGNFLRWPAAGSLRDVNDIMIAEEEETYALIEAMIRSMAENVRSRRINLGMDEAHMVGLGRYLDKHGYCDRTQIILRHLNRVLEITRRYGYKPMMWSDMFFRLACGDYYKSDCPVDPAVVKSIPEDLTLVYWDYYHDASSAIYDKMIRKHHELCPRIAFAGGAWNWLGFSPCSHFSERVGRLAHESCKNNGIREAMITIWGDNGAESSRFAVLPALQLWAEQCYADTQCNGAGYMARRFQTCTGAAYADFMELDKLVLTPDNPSPGRCSFNKSKPLLYQDLLAGLLDCHVTAEDAAYYAACADYFETLRTTGEWDYLFETQYRLARVLELKADAGVRIRQAYRNGDRDILRQYCDQILPKLLGRVEEFTAAFSDQWARENRAQGYAVIDIRFGALLQRLRTAAATIRDYLDGKTPSIELLEEEILPYARQGETVLSGSPFWHEAVCGHTISSI